jgi:hypothetical protein
MQVLIHTWEEHKVACASLPVGKAEPRQPTTTGAYGRLASTWQERPSLNLEVQTCPALSALRKWLEHWVTNGTLKAPQSKGPQRGMTW